ncbi:crcB protein [Alcanivorax sp. MD8A]|uniref:fluoride efflux transporter FluC n=1 Tax=Alcanivorax sp. MD8A TaxID=1177157 RepID=UPI000C9C7678|nr:CrcB family protein [Alcanivorax sp. MD8A]MED5432743.1 CrcB family protein [Pseudomonadota bacterium]MEE2868970.1 CrcB family protein [Pseudomonadota bacterium]PNE01962.1 crcB protein [Alcanivorax sp. MD8A]
MTDVGAVPWLAVAAGGATGACLRFATTLWMGVPAMPAWPWATFSVNLVGSFLFGLLTVALASLTSSEALRLAIMTGMLGALTTFSTFSFELVRMVEIKAWGLAAGYAFASVSICLALGVTGLMLGRMIWE